MSLNYRSVYQIATVIELKKAYTSGTSRVVMSDNEQVHGITFTDHKAENVRVTPELLEQLEREPSIKSIGTVKEIRFENLDSLKKEL